MVKTKQGEIISTKEAFKRFKKGLEQITPLQKLKSELQGTLITLIGFIVSFFAVIYVREKIGILAVGFVLIFLGSIINTGLRFFALRKQIKLFEDMESFNSQGVIGGESSTP